MSSAGLMAARRVIERLIEKGYQHKPVPMLELERAIFHEGGLDSRTVKKYIVSFQKLGWLKRLNRWEWKITYEGDDF